jgi:hypothetical protein
VTSTAAHTQDLAIPAYSNPAYRDRDQAIKPIDNIQGADRSFEFVTSVIEAFDRIGRRRF